MDKLNVLKKRKKLLVKHFILLKLKRSSDKSLKISQ